MIAIAGGGNYSLALRSDGTVWAWGDNTFGQLGDGTFVDKSLPVQVKSADGVGFLKSMNYGITEEGGQDHGASLKDDNKTGGFGCGGIDIKGDGPSGPPDFGGAASFVAILSLPFIFRWWRRMQDVRCKMQDRVSWIVHQVIINANCKMQNKM